MRSVPTPEGDLCQVVAGAADLCRRPLRHAVRLRGEGTPLDCELVLEAREPTGERCPQEDLELELYRSGNQLNLTLAWLGEPERPILWHGSHPVWMIAASGHRCERPQDGAALEALARRLRALLA